VGPSGGGSAARAGSGAGSRFGAGAGATSTTVARGTGVATGAILCGDMTCGAGGGAGLEAIFRGAGAGVALGPPSIGDTTICAPLFGASSRSLVLPAAAARRSEERRVGKECRFRLGSGQETNRSTGV